MNITVIGAGAVGGYFGARMHESGLNVTFLVRQKRADQLRQSGLKVQSPMGNTHVKDVKLAESPEQIIACDLVMLAVKHYHLEQTMETLSTLVQMGARVLPLLNGAEHYDKLKDALGEESVLGGVCHLLSTLDGAGQVVHNGSMHDLLIGALHPSQEPFCLKLLDALAEANIRVSFDENIEQEIWMKYAFITAFSGMTTAARLGIHELLAVPHTHEIFRQALKEMQGLSEASGVPLPEDFEERVGQRLLQLPEGSTSPMHQDLTMGAQLEVDGLHGGALRFGIKLNVELPTIQILHALIKPFEMGAAEKLISLI